LNKLTVTDLAKKMCRNPGFLSKVEGIPYDTHLDFQYDTLHTDGLAIVMMPSRAVSLFFIMINANDVVLAVVADDVRVLFLACYCHFPSL
jgi:hypothetical protein